MDPFGNGYWQVHSAEVFQQLFFYFKQGLGYYLFFRGIILAADAIRWLYAKLAG